MANVADKLTEGWTLAILQFHLDAIRGADQKFDAERDRRYSEVNIEREKALKITEEADKAALGLAREIQSYKDEKANQLREQIGSERGSYATKEDLASTLREIGAAIQPLSTYVASMAGKTKQADQQLGASRAINETTAVSNRRAIMKIAGLALIISVVTPLVLHS